MDSLFPASFFLESLMFFSLGLIYTLGSLVMSPTREKDLSTTHIKLI